MICFPKDGNLKREFSNVRRVTQALASRKPIQGHKRIFKLLFERIFSSYSVNVTFSSIDSITSQAMGVDLM